MIWDIVLFAVMWYVGLRLFAFAVMQVLLVLTCAIPVTKRAARQYRVDKAAIYRRCTSTIVLWTLVTALVVYLTMHFGNGYVKTGFWIGMGYAALFGMGGLGVTIPNLEDYFQAYGRHYGDDLESAIEDSIGVLQ